MDDDEDDEDIDYFDWEGESLVLIKKWYRKEFERFERENRENMFVLFELVDFKDELMVLQILFKNQELIVK